MKGFIKYPVGTVVTKTMMADVKAVARAADREREEEIAQAKFIKAETGCSRGEALRAAAEHAQA